MITKQEHRELVNKRFIRECEELEIQIDYDIKASDESTIVVTIEKKLLIPNVIENVVNKWWMGGRI